MKVLTTKMDAKRNTTVEYETSRWSRSTAKYMCDYFPGNGRVPRPGDDEKTRERREQKYCRDFFIKKAQDGEDGIYFGKHYRPPYQSAASDPYMTDLDLFYLGLHNPDFDAVRTEPTFTGDDFIEKKALEFIRWIYQYLSDRGNILVPHPGISVIRHEMMFSEFIKKQINAEDSEFRKMSNLMIEKIWGMSLEEFHKARSTRSSTLSCRLPKRPTSE